MRTGEIAPSSALTFPVWSRCEGSPRPIDGCHQEQHLLPHRAPAACVNGQRLCHRQSGQRLCHPRSSWTRETITLERRAQHARSVLNHVMAGEHDDRRGGRHTCGSRSARSAGCCRLPLGALPALVHGNPGGSRRTASTTRPAATLVELPATTLYRASTGPTSPTCSPSARGSSSRPGRCGGSSPRLGCHPSRTRRPRGHRTPSRADGPGGHAPPGRRQPPRLARGPGGPGSRSSPASTTRPGSSPAGRSARAEDAAGYLEMLRQTVERHGLPARALHRPPRHLLKESEPPADPRRAVRRPADAHPGRPGARAVGHPLDRRPQPPGEGSRRAPLGHPPGPLRVRAPPGSDRDARRGERALRLVRAAPQRRFAVGPAEPAPAWRPWPEGLPPEAVFCFDYPRRVARDATIGWDGGALGLPRRPGGRSWAGRAVTVQEHLDGSLWVSHGGLCLPLAPAPADPRELRARHRSRRVEDLPDIEVDLTPADPQPPAPPEPAARTPAHDHPWRRSFSPRRR